MVPPLEHTSKFVDTLIDELEYCNPLGKSLWDSMLYDEFERHDFNNRYWWRDIIDDDVGQCGRGESFSSRAFCQISLLDQKKERYASALAFYFLNSSYDRGHYNKSINFCTAQDLDSFDRGDGEIRFDKFADKSFLNGLCSKLNDIASNGLDYAILHAGYPCNNYLPISPETDERVFFERETDLGALARHIARFSAILLGRYRPYLYLAEKHMPERDRAAFESYREWQSKED